MLLGPSSKKNRGCIKWYIHTYIKRYIHSYLQNMVIGSFNIWTKLVKASTTHLLILEAAFSLLILLSNPVNVKKKFFNLLINNIGNILFYVSLLLLHTRDWPRCRDPPNTEPTMVTVLLTHHILYTIQCTPDNAHYTMNNDYSILYTVYSTLYKRLSESAGTWEQCLRPKGFCAANKVIFGCFVAKFNMSRVTHYLCLYI